MDIVNAKKECLSYDARLEHDMKSWVRDEVREMILKDSIKNNRQVDEKVKVVKKELMDKIELQIKEYCDDRLNLPDLVGEKCPYSSLSNFLITFHTKTEKSVKEMKL